MIKSVIRDILSFLRIDLTKNLAYDRMSRQLIRKYILPTDSCVDVGAHTADVLRYIAKQAPRGHHLAFEPLPHLYEKLKSTWGTQISIFPFALSDSNGKSEFQWVKNAPAYSGFKKRHYAIKHPDIKTIEVETRRLDDFQNPETPIRLMKIDVEGAEFLVLKGAMDILKTDRPFVLFEFGLGSSDYYQSSPEDLLRFFNALDYELFSLKDALKKKPALDFISFNAHYKNNSEYYFWAAPI